ncbi:DBH-like monooxygenase protein 2 homolog [Anneissia japonica]|uniref:DBH-like monooxygenase protein 2 homolog n=1 Tax=Anneissia japonica TaxID=1529436 RepID=UPI001425A3D8|nr:DBH-like monooxygenase protein 2 homolog [Anneissia japonica]
MDREKPTFNGLASMDEMCVAFLMYYPKANADRCMSNPHPKNLETLLNLGDTRNKTLRQALENMEWTNERKYAARRWFMTSRVLKCTNYSANSVFPKYKNIPGYGSIVEAEGLDSLIDFQNQAVEEDKCSHALNLKAAYLSVFAFVISVSLIKYHSVNYVSFK